MSLLMLILVCATVLIAGYMLVTRTARGRKMYQSASQTGIDLIHRLRRNKPAEAPAQ